MYQNFFIHLSVNGHLGCFHIQGIANSVAMNIRVHVSFFFFFPFMVFSGYMLSNGVARLYGSFSLSFFFFLFFFKESLYCSLDFPRGTRGKEPTCQYRRHKRRGLVPGWFGKISWRRAWQSTLVFFPGVSHGQKSLVGYSP